LLVDKGHLAGGPTGCAFLNRRLEGRMRGYHWFAIALLAVVYGVSSGCKSPGGPSTVVTPEPSLSGAIDSDGSRVTTAPSKNVTFVDRHPLFSKPRDYWDTSGNNKVVKAAAATFVGVPAGLYGEVKQIIVGTPAAVKY
jgi:hypothetical protein